MDAKTRNSNLNSNTFPGSDQIPDDYSEGLGKDECCNKISGKHILSGI
jgi:hypothetical protein